MKLLEAGFFSARRMGSWALLLVLFLGAGFSIAACGEDSTPTPTTPTLPAPPTPTPPAPEAPAAPTGLAASAAGADFIEWSWKAVEGAAGYQVQFSANEAFTSEDEIVARTAEQISYRKEGIAAETKAYLRVRAFVGEGDDRVYSSWSTHVTGTTTAAAPTAPAAPIGLEVSATGSDFIEWTWKAVEGAAGYQVQFSDDKTFGDGDPLFILTGAQNTKHRVPNLTGSSTGYLRVRAWAGTVTEPLFGEWVEEPSEGTTKKPAAPTALAAPKSLLTGDETDTSISIAWKAVDGADHYEVEQQVDGTSSWAESSCGGADEDNEVDDASCVASDLDSGTDYGFRIRAIPASSNAAKKTGAWSSTVSSTTTGTAPSGGGGSNRTPDEGAGSLNVRWTSTADSITWIWDRLPGAEYEIQRPSKETCDVSGDWESDKPTRTSYTISESEVVKKLLCVRTKNSENLRENLSFAWGITSPSPSTVGDPTIEDEITKAITWSGFSLKKGFGYEARVVANPVRNGDSTKEIQDRCDSGPLLKDQNPTSRQVDNIRITMDRNLKPYTGYLLCLRYENDSGESDWSVPKDNEEIQTRPGKPRSPSVFSSSSSTPTMMSVVWQVDIPESDLTVPDDHTGFKARTIKYRQYLDEGGKRVRTTAPKVAVCSDSNGGKWNIADNVKITNSFDGIYLEADFEKPEAKKKEGDLGYRRVHICVQAVSEVGNGPWRLSRYHEIPRQKAAKAGKQ